MKPIIFALFLMTSPLAWASEFGVRDQNQVSMIQSYKAYAAYKMGLYDEAYEIWLPLANSGHTSSMINIANLYFQEQGSKVSCKEAEEWLLKAKSLGDERAQEMFSEINHNSGDQANMCESKIP